MLRTGGCLCGDVRYEIDSDFDYLTYCHCSQCRRQTGHYSATVGLRRHSVVLSKDSGLKWYRSSPEAERGFCGTCGSNLFWQQTAPGDGSDDGFIAVFLGTLDDSSGLTMKHHIHVADKGGYYPICDGLPTFDHDDGC